MKHTLYEAIFQPVTVEIPEECPDCKSDFTQPGSLTEGNWNDCTVGCHIEKPESITGTETRDPQEPEIQGEEQSDYGDTYYPTDLCCRKCGWLVTITGGDPEIVHDSGFQDGGLDA